MNALPPTLLAGRLRGSRRATPAAGALMVLVALVTAACDSTVSPSPTTSPPVSSAPTTDAQTATPAATPTSAPTTTPAPTGTPGPDLAGLVVAGDGNPTLGLLTDAGTITPLNAPRRQITFLRSAPHGLLAVLRDGSVAVGRVDGSAATWTIDRRFSGVGAADIDPSGSTLAIESRLRIDEGRLLRLRIAPLATGPSRPITVTRLRSNGPPVWLSEGRVAVVANTTSGADVLAVVDAASGKATTIPFDAIDIAASGDGKTVALVEPAAIRVGPVDDLGQATFGQAVSLVPPEGATLLEAALDATGERIAFAWEDENQVPVAIEIATAASGWRVVGRVDVPSGATRIRLAWLG